MIENVSGFARAADVVIDLLRETLDELRGMRIEVAQSLGSLRADVTTLQTEVTRIGRQVADAAATPKPPRRPTPSAHGAPAKRPGSGPRRR